MVLKILPEKSAQLRRYELFWVENTSIINNKCVNVSKKTRWSTDGFAFLPHPL